MKPDVINLTNVLLSGVVHEIKRRRRVPVLGMLLLRLIERSELHVFGRCGHWTQIERAAEFNALLVRFLAATGGVSS